VFPQEIVITSSDPSAFDGLGGFVETATLDISGARETVERRTALNLPQGLSPVGNQTVLVTVTITPILDTRNLELPIEIQGLPTDLAATTTPKVVTVLLTGPLAVLEALELDEVRVVLNLVDYEPGTYLLTPEVIVPPTEIETQILPETIEVTIGEAPPTTPTPTP
jgi:YbbR domain-containing protein